MDAPIALKSPTSAPALPGAPGITGTSGGGWTTTARLRKPPTFCAGPLRNADGSTDLYLASTAPEGEQANWLRTVLGKGYFAILRVYSPTEAAIDKSWKPGDIEKMN
jgi:Protein of unknown function (DUF1214)